MPHVSISVAVAFACTAAAARHPDALRADGVPVRVLGKGILEEQHAAVSLQGYPFKQFSAQYVAAAKAAPTDWMAKGAVTPAKDQGSLGACGTFGRTAAAEGQYAIRSGHARRNFSEELLVDCPGWEGPQVQFWQPKGFMSMEDYPYNTTGDGDADPPIPGRPCRYDPTKVIEGTANFSFTNTTSVPVDEDQMIAMLHKNGPVNTGIVSKVFLQLSEDCYNGNSTTECFITADMCNVRKVKRGWIDHSITLTAYGTDPAKGDYWIIKNSWSTQWANNGFVKIQRGIGCAQIQTAGFVPIYGDASDYFES